MTPITANPADDPERAHDLARLRELTGPHLLHPAAPIGPALVLMNAADRGEAVDILGRLGDPRERATDDDVA
jgi:hypothetical protein